MTSYTKAQLLLLERAARIAAGVPEPKGVLDLVGSYLPDVLEQIAAIAKQAPAADVRLKASMHITELAEKAQIRLDKIEDKNFTGSPEAIAEVLKLPFENRRDALAQLFTTNHIGKSDYDTLIHGLNAELEAQVKALVAECERLVRIIEGNEQAKLINGTPLINGHVNN